MTQLPDIDFEKYLKQRESDLYLQKVDRPTQHLEKALERLSGRLKPMVTLFLGIKPMNTSDLGKES